METPEQMSNRLLQERIDNEQNPQVQLGMRQLAEQMADVKAQIRNAGYDCRTLCYTLVDVGTSATKVAEIQSLQVQEQVLRKECQDRREKLQELKQSCDAAEARRGDLRTFVDLLTEEIADLGPVRRRLTGEVNTLWRRDRTLRAAIENRENNLASLRNDKQALMAKKRSLQFETTRLEKDKEKLLQPRNRMIMQEIITRKMTVEPWRKLVGTRLVRGVLTSESRWTHEDDVAEIE